MEPNPGYLLFIFSTLTQWIFECLNFHFLIFFFRFLMIFCFISADEDCIICDDGTRATFLRDIKGNIHNLNGSYQSKEVAKLSLTELLQGFFEFYGLFDYQKNAICVVQVIF